jgi:hypothetical protein
MPPTQTELQNDYRAFIQSADTLAAFDYLIDHKSRLSEYQCCLKGQGFLRTLRYKNGTSWPFGFIVNRTSILFYFRKAGLSNPAASYDSLSKQFDVTLNNRNEIKVRLQNETDAKRLALLVFRQG